MGRYDNKVKTTANDSLNPQGICSCFLTSCKTGCDFTCKGAGTKSISPPRAKSTE